MGAAHSRDIGLPPQNVTLAPRELHIEVMDPRSFDVWLCQSPITLEESRAFRPEPPFLKSGVAAAAMDQAWFTRSPGAAADGALETRTIGGREFARVARPLNFRGLAKGDAPTRVDVDKHHVLTFRAGAKVALAKIGGHWHVQQTVRPPTMDAIAPPGDWEMRMIELDADWQVVLPNPCAVWFFKNLDSYAGPVPDVPL